MSSTRIAALSLAAIALAVPALADGIVAKSDDKVAAPFDIVRTEVTTQGSDLVFRIAVRQDAGADKPKATGKFEGSDVHAYVWPTSLDSAAAGFEPGQGILSLAVTFHPDFDDGAGGARNRDVWHPHWVVLVKDDACGRDALKVKDIPNGAKPRLPATWPGVALLIDSPDYPTRLDKNAVEVRVPLAKIAAPAKGASYDGVTSALRVNANLHAPLLCVVNVFDVASGDLSLPGKVE